MSMEYVKIVDDVVVASAVCPTPPGDDWAEMPGWSELAAQRPPLGDWQYKMSAATWVPIAKSEQQTADEARAERNARLAASDWTQLPDVPEATRSAWAGYRQALRDITSQPGFPMFVNWPETP